jgi:hypothetical protein
MKFAIIPVAALLGLLWISPLNAEMTGATFDIISDSFSFTSVDEISGETFEVFSTGGELGATSTEGASFVLRGGFQAQDQSILGYDINVASLNLGELSQDSVSTANMTVTVSTGSDTGYTLSVTEDGDLRSDGGDTINDVTDGTVTAGQEEYGMRTSGPDGLLSTDRGISGNLDVASSNARGTSRVTTISFSASQGTVSRPGAYRHILTFTVTVNP